MQSYESMYGIINSNQYCNLNSLIYVLYESNKEIKILSHLAKHNNHDKVNFNLFVVSSAGDQPQGSLHMLDKHLALSYSKSPKRCLDCVLL